MYFRTRQTLSLRVLSYASPFAMALFLLYAFPTSVVAQGATSDTPPPTVLDASDDEELSSLTVAQQKARQLATTLIGERESSVTSSQRTPLEVIADQTRRLRVPLFTSTHLEGWLVGGRRTFISPVDYAPSSAPEDARRPLFIPALEEALMALEILAR